MEAARKERRGAKLYAVAPMTRAEIDALLKGALVVNAFFGPPPDPPTPGMVAQRKLENAEEIR